MKLFTSLIFFLTTAIVGVAQVLWATLKNGVDFEILIYAIIYSFIYFSKLMYQYLPVASLGRMLVTCVALIAAAAPLIAQVTPVASAKPKDDSVITLNPFIITSKKDTGYRSQQTLVGSRTAKNLLEVSSSVSIINRELIDDMNATSVHEVLQFGVAGVTQNVKHNDDVNIRGFRTIFSLRNGVTKISYKRNPMYDVERVEVIKGPGAMLLGNNSFLGGGVNLVSIKPTHQRSGDVQLTFSHHNYVRLAANLMGPAYQSKNMTIDYRATVGFLKADADKEIWQEDQQFFGAGLAMYFGANTSVMVNGYFYKDNGYFYWDDFLDYTTTLGTTTAPLTGKLNRFSTKNFSPARSKDAYWTNQDSFVDITFLTKITDNADLRLYYFGGSVVDRRRHVRGITVLADNHTLARQDLPLRLDNDTNNIQGDFNHRLKAPGFTLDTTIGVDASSSPTKQDQSVNVMPSLDTAVAGFPNDDAYFAVARPGAGLPNLQRTITRPTTLSYYFQENLSFLQDKLILVGGLRWFRPGGSDRNDVTGVVTDRPNTPFKTHKYGIVVRPIPALSLYYTDSENAFPQAGFTDRFQGNDALGAPLSVQEGKMKEYGLKVEHAFNDSISVHATYANYDMALTHVRTLGILPEGRPPGSIGIVESAADFAQGWELEYGARAKLSAGNLDLIGTYVDGKSQTAADKTVMAVDFVPQKISLMGRFGWTSGPLKGFGLGASYFDQTRKRNASYWIDFPATYNVFARYEWRKNWSVQLNLNNITDERYIVGIASTGLVQVEQGFDAKLALRYKY